MKFKKLKQENIDKILYSGNEEDIDFSSINIFLRNKNVKKVRRHLKGKITRIEFGWDC